MGEKVDVEIICDDNVVTVIFEAASICDPEAIAAVSNQIDDFLEKNQPKAVVVDFEQVKFFSSQVLGTLLSIRTKLQSNDGEIVISAINPQLHRVFTITNLDKIFRFFPDKESAVAAIKTG